MQRRIRTDIIKSVGVYCLTYYLACLRRQKSFKPEKRAKRFILFRLPTSSINKQILLWYWGTLSLLAPKQYHKDITAIGHLRQAIQMICGHRIADDHI